MEERIVYSKDLQNKDIEALFEFIMDSNELLYGCLTDYLDKSSSVGIRKDILEFLSHNSADLSDNKQFISNLVEASCNPKMSLDHIRFMIDYYNDMSESKISLEEFGLTFSACVQSNIPLSDIKDWFYSDDDAVSIIEKINMFISDPDIQKESVDKQADDKVSSNNHSYNHSPSASSASSNSVSVNSGKQKDSFSSDIETVSNVLTIMTFQDENDIDAVNDTQNGFSGFINKLQSSVSDLSVFSTEVINTMKRNEDSIRKFRALLSVMETMLSSKQFEINNLRFENEQLKEKIKNYELSNMKNDELTQKINEVCKLANANSVGGTNMYLN